MPSTRTRSIHSRLQGQQHCIVPYTGRCSACCQWRKGAPARGNQRPSTQHQRCRQMVTEGWRGLMQRHPQNHHAQLLESRQPLVAASVLLLLLHRPHHRPLRPPLSSLQSSALDGINITFDQNQIIRPPGRCSFGAVSSHGSSGSTGATVNLAVRVGRPGSASTISERDRPCC